MAWMPVTAGVALLVTMLAVPGAAAIDTDPGVSPSFALFPGHDEVVAALRERGAHPGVTLHALGTSEEGREILLAEVTSPTSAVPMEDRVVTFIFTQQHGNEPAGTPAALRLLDSIVAKDDIASTLDDQILLLLPMANPDGATLNQRANNEGNDINRDHIHLETAEANVLHLVLNKWDVHVAMDHHEYGGIGFGNPVPVRLYDYDLTTMFPNHGNVLKPASDASNKLMYEGIWPAAVEAGFTANEYGEQTVAGVPVQQVAGGPDPGIMRNHLGLHHVAGLLVETRVDAHPNPFHDAERRTAIHSNVMESTLRYVHDNAEMFRNAKTESLRLAVEQPAEEYVEGDVRGDLALAYRVPADAGTEALFVAHGLPRAFYSGKDVIHDIRHGHQGHAAAIVHPLSSRAVAEGEPVDPPIVGARVEAPDEASATPAAGFASALVAFAALALVRRRR